MAAVDECGIGKEVLRHEPRKRQLRSLSQQRANAAETSGHERFPSRALERILIGVDNDVRRGLTLPRYQTSTADGKGRAAVRQTDFDHHLSVLSHKKVT